MPSPLWVVAGTPPAGAADARELLRAHLSAVLAGTAAFDLEAIAWPDAGVSDDGEAEDWITGTTTP